MLKNIFLAIITGMLVFIVIFLFTHFNNEQQITTTYNMNIVGNNNVINLQPRQ